MEHLPSLAVVHVLIVYRNRNSPTVKAIKTRLKSLMSSQAFYNFDEILTVLDTAKLADKCRVR